jgi:hypothetical protein
MKLEIQQDKFASNILIMPKDSLIDFVKNVN